MHINSAEYVQFLLLLDFLYLPKLAECRTCDNWGQNVVHL